MLLFLFSIVVITVATINKITGATFLGKLHLVDLAGSERIIKSGSIGERMNEACNINQRFNTLIIMNAKHINSLTTLGKVLNSIASKNPYIPYRESKLTHLLKDSLGGNSKTLLVIQVSPDPKDFAETVSTLQFGTRVNKIERPRAKQNIMELTQNKNNDTPISLTAISSNNLIHSGDVAENQSKTLSHTSSMVHLRHKSSFSGVPSRDPSPYYKDKQQFINKITVKLDSGRPSLASNSNKENSKSGLIARKNNNS